MIIGVSNITLCVAVLAACWGCVIRYTEVHKHNPNKAIKWSYFIVDLITSGFLGFLTFWFLIEHNYTKISYAMFITCVVGNIGSRVIDIGSYYLYQKLGLNYKYQELLDDTDKRDKK